MVSVDRELASLALNDKADLLWTDEHFTRTQLFSENWHARYFSFKALLSIWIQDDDEKLNLSTTTVLNDSNDQVVIAALDAIGEILAGSFNRDFSRFLAKVVSTESKIDWCSHCSV